MSTETTYKKLKLVALIAGLCACGGVSPTFAAQATINGGGSSQWSIDDLGSTTNGLPAGGNCGAGGAQASIVDASIPAGVDAFDYGGMIWVDDTPIGGPLLQTGNLVAFANNIVSGLDVQMSYEALTTSATLRILLTLTNSTGSPISVSVDYATNFGSDGGTQVRGTSSGDTTFTNTDSWVVTSDAGDSDPVNNTVIFGAGGANVTPSSVSQTVFNCAGTEGVLATYNSVTVPAGSAISLMFFQRMSDTTPNALTEAAEFDSAGLSADLLDGLSASQLAQIQNFALGAAPPAPPAPPAPAEPVPTMSIYGLMLSALGLAFAGMINMRRTSRRD